MTNAASMSSRQVSASRGDRIVLFAEALVFVLPCYLIYLACVPWALVAVGTLPSAIGELIVHKGSAFAVSDVVGFLPFGILGVTACWGICPLWRAPRLIFRVLWGRPVGAPKAAMLTKTVRLAILPLTVMVIAWIYISIPALSRGSTWAAVTWEDQVLGFYLSGLPLLIPAFHLWRIFTTATMDVL